MDLEVAILPCKDGNSAGMIKAMEEAGKAGLLACPGCNSVKVLPGVENPGTVLFLIEWDSAQAHEDAKTHEGFQKFYEAAGPYFGGEGDVSMQHFKLG